MYSKLDDEFFVFNDFNSNEGILYSDEGQNFIPLCIAFHKIDVIEETTNCYRDIPVLLKNQDNDTIKAFLTQERILRTTSKVVPCKNNSKHVSLPESNRIITLKENQIEFGDNKR